MRKIISFGISTAITGVGTVVNTDSTRHPQLAYQYKYLWESPRYKKIPRFGGFFISQFPIIFLLSV